MSGQSVDRERLVATFTELVRINAPSRHEGAVAHRVAGMLRELGANVMTDQAGTALEGEIGNLIAVFPGTIIAPALLFCAHLDTVQPTETLSILEADGVLTSDGTTILGADDKAGVAAIVEMLRMLCDSKIPHPPLEIAFTVAEEIGLMGSSVLDYSLLSARYGFVPDSSGAVGKIITRAPAQQHLQVVIKGCSAHAGMAPEQGISAITIAARAIARMKQGRIDDETTANIGVIHGGHATNIVPETVEIEGEARSRDPRKLAEQVEHMRRCFEEEAAAAGAQATVTVTDVYPAFNLDEESRPVRLAGKALREMGLTPSITATGGGSDANFLNGHGIQTVILSAGYHNPHSTTERLEIDELIRLTQWLYRIVELAGAGS